MVQYILHGLWIVGWFIQVRISLHEAYPRPTAHSRSSMDLFHGGLELTKPATIILLFWEQKDKYRSDKGAKVQVARAPGPINLGLRQGLMAYWQRVGFGSWQLVCASVLNDKLQPLPRSGWVVRTFHWVPRGIVGIAPNMEVWPRQQNGSAAPSGSRIQCHSTCSDGRRF